MKKPRPPEVKTVTFRFKTTLKNAALKEWGENAQRELERIVSGWGREYVCRAVAKPRVEAVGKR